MGHCRLDQYPGTGLPQSSATSGGGIRITGKNAGNRGLYFRGEGSSETTDCCQEYQFLSNAGDIELIAELDDSYSKIAINGDTYFATRKDSTAVQGVTPIAGSSSVTTKLTADVAIDMDNAIEVNGAGEIIFAPYTSGKSISVYSTSKTSGYDLGVWGSENIQNGFSRITYGDSASGAIATSGAFTVNDPIKFTSASGGLTIGAAITTNNNDLTVSMAGDSAATGAYLALGSGQLTKTESSSLNLGGANTYTGGTVITGGTLQASNAGAVGSGDLSIDGGTLQISANIDSSSGLNSADLVLGSSGGTFLIDSGITAGLAGVISGAGAFTKTGAGTLELSGANTFTGATSVTGGILKLANSNVFGGTTSLTIDGATLQISADMSDSSSDTFTLGSGGATFDVDSGITATFNGAIGGSGSLTKDGYGSLTLSGSNTYSGQTYVNYGTLSVNSSSPTSSTTTCSSYATCTFPRSGGGSASSSATTTTTTT
ncbi:MAG: hypothetical protein GY918_03470, partial [Gammaproteobacteria bacterium]|nr:hypothetical protein [Gammaproteobacteria bacterium]